MENVTAISTNYFAQATGILTPSGRRAPRKGAELEAFKAKLASDRAAREAERAAKGLKKPGPKSDGVSLVRPTTRVYAMAGANPEVAVSVQRATVASFVSEFGRPGATNTVVEFGAILRDAGLSRLSRLQVCNLPGNTLQFRRRKHERLGCTMGSINAW